MENFDSKHPDKFSSYVIIGWIINTNEELPYVRPTP